MTPFADLRSGGVALAHALESYADRADVVVLGIVRGGIPVAVEVATRLRVAFDVMHLQRLLLPDGPRSAICASYVAGTRVIDEALAHHRGDAAFEIFLAEAFARLDQREQIVRGSRAPRDLAGETVLLVDNGIRSGSTMRSSIRAVRRSSPARVIAAVPVGAPESREEIESLADEVVCLGWLSPFGNAGMWYGRFDVPADDSLPDARCPLPET